MKKFLSGLIIGAMLMSTTSVFAEKVDVLVGQLKFVVDGKEIVDGKKAGNETLVYNNTVYISLPTVAKAFNKEAGYDTNGKVATLKSKAEAPAPTVANEYTHIVNKAPQYSLKINSVKTMTERNQFSEKKPKQVIIVDYEYKNLGSDKEVYLGDSNFKVIDSDGSMGYSYPNTVTNYPQSLVKDSKCSAQAIFGLDHETKQVTLNFYDNMFGSVTKTFKINVQ